jgi:hypothetical protein
MFEFTKRRILKRIVSENIEDVRLIASKEEYCWANIEDNTYHLENNGDGTCTFEFRIKEVWEKYEISLKSLRAMIE